MSAAPISSTAWRNAVFAVLTFNGFAIATVLARLPGLRDHLHVEPGGVGLILAFFAGGSLVGLACSGPLLHALGAARITRLALPVLSVSFAGVAVAAAWLESYAATAATIAVLGGCVSLCDVAMNVEGAALERKAGRAVMPLLHGGFSLGTVIGAGLGALAAQLSIGVVPHFAACAAIGLVVAVVVPRWIPAVAEDAPPKPTLAQRRAVWAQPRTILLGLVVFAFAYIEGAANDWLVLGLVDERGFDQAQGALMLGVFTAAMTIARFVGSPMVDRFGRMPILVGSALVAAVGSALVIFVPETWAVVVGVVVWAVGSALGFPIGLSAAGDDPATAASRVAAVSLIGYAAFFAGPPVVGLIADRTGILPALAVVLVLIALALVASPSVRPAARAVAWDGKRPPEAQGSGTT
ncbi:MAG: hypothetical protein BGO95_08955 [Micrococcales bacterium 73-13]|nr:MAG: hypothetical protein BGO95_08955 [Micrococcales bacterium 73-13]